ncbi:MAG: DUF4097 family beta strand repeat-containing protein [bacterium]|nr:DUF4097 family beta strand repeat-containing protein [bacterium]
MKKTIAGFLVAGVILAGIPGNTTAQTTVNQSRPAAVDGIVEVMSTNGSVQVIGWGKQEVVVEGVLGKKTERLVFEGDGYRTRVRVPEGNRDAEPSHLKIHVPAGSQVEVATSGADIEISRATGMLYLQSVTGDIRVQGSPREIDARSVQGEIEISVSQTRVKANSTGGRITLKETSGEADLSTVSGNLVVEGGKYRRGRFTTVSGDVRFEGGMDRNSVFEFSSHSGKVELYLPGSVEADFLVSTYRGEIENDFQPSRTSRESVGQPSRKRYSFSTQAPGGRRRLDHWQGSEDALRRARVMVNSFSGNVRLKKVDE